MLDFPILFIQYLLNQAILCFVSLRRIRKALFSRDVSGSKKALAPPLHLYTDIAVIASQIHTPHVYSVIIKKH